MTEEQAQRAYNILHTVRTIASLPENSTEGDKGLISDIDDLLSEIDAGHFVAHLPVMSAPTASELYQRYKKMREAADSIDVVTSERDTYHDLSDELREGEEKFIGHIIAIQDLLRDMQEHNYCSDKLTASILESKEYNYFLGRVQAYLEVEAAARGYLHTDWDAVKSTMKLVQAVPGNGEFKFEARLEDGED